MKKIFSLQTDLTDYRYPLIKIMISVFVIVCSITRNSFFDISSKLLNIVVASFCCVITIASILCIYIAVFELIYVRKNRTKSRK